MISYISIEAAQLTLKDVAHEFSDIGIVQSKSQYSFKVLLNPMVSFPIINMSGEVRLME